MLNIVHSYAKKWRYSINADKSAMMVFGESAKSRRSGREHRKWCLGADLISETDEQHHLGILRDVYNSTIHRTNERRSAARSAFYSLNSIGTRFGHLHPLTSLRLYRALSLPILLYGSEIWTLSKSELLLMERLHRKILCTLQGLPTRCKSSALTTLLGLQSVEQMINHRMLSFVVSVANLSERALPRRFSLLELIAARLKA